MLHFHKLRLQCGLCQCMNGGVRDTISHQFRPGCGVGSMLAAIGGACAATACHHGTGGKEGSPSCHLENFSGVIESFTTYGRAQTAAGTWALVDESAGKVWLFTLGTAGGSSEGGAKVAEVGPSPGLLHRSISSGSMRLAVLPGSTTPVHTHPGAETFFVLTGAQSVRTPHGLMVVKAGEALTGPRRWCPDEVSASGSTDLHALVAFMLDATKPFSSPANFP